MNLAVFRVAVLVALAAFISAPAFAQYEATDKSTFGVGVSFMRPSGDELRDIKDLWMGVSLDYHFRFDEFDRPSTVVSVGWFGNDREFTKANLIPVRGTYIKRFRGGAESTWYVGGGLGVYFTNYKSYGFDPRILRNTWMTDSGMKLGMNLIGGLEFGGGWYAEAKYDKVGKLSRELGPSIDFSGLTLSFGSRLAL